MPVGLGQLRVFALKLILETFALGHIARETARVAKLAAFPAPIRMNQYVLDRAVLATKPRGLIVDGVACQQAVRDLIDDFGIEMKLGNVMPDVFLG